MRSFLFAAPIILLAVACSSTPVVAPAPEAKPAAVEAKPAAAAPAAAPAAKAPQCYNGETGNFDAVGTKATVAGVKVECKLTTDGKSAVWHGAK